MQDTEHQNPQSPDELSPVPTSEIVHVETDSSIPKDASTDQLLIFKPTLRPQPVWLLVEQIKGHTQLVLGTAIGVFATLLLGQFNSSTSSSVPLRPIALNHYFKLGPGGLHGWKTSGDSGPTIVEIPRSPGNAAAPQPSPQLQFIDRFYFTKNAGGGEIPADPTWFMVDRFYFAGKPPTQAPLAAENRDFNTGFPDSGLNSFPPPADNQYPSNFGNQGRLDVPPPPNFALSGGIENIPYGTNAGGEIPNLSAIDRRQHTLLGVIETNNFSAALIQTNGSSYSVRIGDKIRRSDYVLTELESDKAIFNNGQSTLVINVGEQF